MPSKHLFIFFFACLLCSCQEKMVENPFTYPESKTWAHRVNTMEEARIKSSVFEGLEIDLYYNPRTDQLLLGHDLQDTINGLNLDAWLEAVEEPAAHYYWLDMKNLNADNAARIADNINRVAEKWHITDHVMIEQWDVSALKIIKKHSLHVILWVDNLYESGHSEEKWRLTMQKDIDNLHPNAISGNYQMFHILTECFPEQNIHLWDTPKEYNETNVTHTRMLIQHPSIKVVLVDYPESVTP